MADTRAKLPPLPIPVRGETWRTYVELFRRDGRWAERFVSLYLRGEWSVPAAMQEDADAARAAWLRGNRPEFPEGSAKGSRDARRSER